MVDPFSNDSKKIQKNWTLTRVGFLCLLLLGDGFANECKERDCFGKEVTNYSYLRLSGIELEFY